MVSLLIIENFTTFQAKLNLSKAVKIKMSKNNFIYLAKTFTTEA